MSSQGQCHKYANLIRDLELLQMFLLRHNISWFYIFQHPKNIDSQSQIPTVHLKRLIARVFDLKSKEQLRIHGLVKACCDFGLY